MACFRSPICWMWDWKLMSSSMSRLGFYPGAKKACAGLRIASDSYVGYPGSTCWMFAGCCILSGRKCLHRVWCNRTWAYLIEVALPVWLYPCLQNASSAGAIAGFAIAVICTWRYLKGPRPQPNKRFTKRDAPSSSTPSMETSSEAMSTAIAKSITQPTQRGVIIRDSSSTAQVRYSLDQSVIEMLS